MEIPWGDQAAPGHRLALLTAGGRKLYGNRVAPTGGTRGARGWNDTGPEGESNRGLGPIRSRCGTAGWRPLGCGATWWRRWAALAGADR